MLNVIDEMPKAFSPLLIQSVLQAAAARKNGVGSYVGSESRSSEAERRLERNTDWRGEREEKRESNGMGLDSRQGPGKQKGAGNASGPEEQPRQVFVIAGAIGVSEYFVVYVDGTWSLQCHGHWSKAFDSCCDEFY